MQKKQKQVQDFSVEELKIAGFELYQARTVASQRVNELTQQLNLVNEELNKRNQQPVEIPKAPVKKKK